MAMETEGMDAETCRASCGRQELELVFGQKNKEQPAAPSEPEGDRERARGPTNEVAPPRARKRTIWGVGAAKRGWEKSQYAHSQEATTTLDPTVQNPTSLSAT